MAIKALLRENIRNFEAYSSAREIHAGMDGIFLDANENSLEPVFGVGLNRYPDPLQKQLKIKIAEIKQVDTNRIFLGNGSDEPIDLLIRAFCEPGKDKILICPPTYGMYEVCADLNAVGVIKVDLGMDFNLRIERILAELTDHVKLVYLCSPNNPTGNLMEGKTVCRLLEESPGIVVIDEAYLDFSGTAGWVPHLEEFENLVVLQTFSKAWGMANARVGMAFGSPELVDVLNRIKYPYNINGLSQEVVFKALAAKDKKDFLVSQIVRERELLRTALDELPIVETVFPSQANFLLVRFRQARRVYTYLLEHKVLVRDRSQHPLTRECLRITVGAPDQNETLMYLLKQADL